MLYTVCMDQYVVRMINSFAHQSWIVTSSLTDISGHVGSLTHKSIRKNNAIIGLNYCRLIAH